MRCRESGYLLDCLLVLVFEEQHSVSVAVGVHVVGSVEDYD